jgi:hypothetical protein
MTAEKHASMRQAHCMHGGIIKLIIKANAVRLFILAVPGMDFNSLTIFSPVFFFSSSKILSVK